MRNQLTLQSESAECGLACIAMVAAAHGHRETLSEFRRRFPISLGGSSLKTLIAIADTLGFSTRPLRCDLDELKQLQAPAILHWSLDHYVVLRRAGTDARPAFREEGHRRTGAAGRSLEPAVGSEAVPDPDVPADPVDAGDRVDHAPVQPYPRSTLTATSLRRIGGRVQGGS